MGKDPDTGLFHSWGPIRQSLLSRPVFLIMAEFPQRPPAGPFSVPGSKKADLSATDSANLNKVFFL